MAVGLHDGRGDQHQSVKDDGKAQNRHQPGRHCQIPAGISPQQGGDRLGQQGKAEGTGHGDQPGDPHGGFLRGLGFIIAAEGQVGSDGGNDTDGNGGDEGAGHVENGQAHTVNAPHGVGRGLGVAQIQQLPHVNFGFQHGHQLQGGGAEGDGNGNGQQPPGGLPVGTRLFLRPGQKGVALPEAAEQVNRRDKTACRDAQNRAARGQRNLVGHFQNCQRRAHAHDQLHHGLQHLRNGGGQHVPLPLEEAPVGTHNADQQHAGAKAADGRPGVGLVLEGRQLAAEHRHQQTARNAQRQKNTPCGMVNPAHLIVVVKGAGLRDHPAHGHGQPGGGDHQQDVIDVVGRVEVAEALFADDGVEGNFVQSADDLDNGRCHCKQRGALKKILLFLHVRHGFILSAGKMRRDASLLRLFKQPGDGVFGQLLHDLFHVDGGESAVFIQDSAPHHGHGHVAALGRPDEAVQNVVAGNQMGRGKVNERNVRVHAHLKHSAFPGASLSLGAGDGGHHQGGGRRQGGRIAAFLPGGHGGKAHDLKHVQIAALDGAAGAEGYVHPRLDGFQNRGGGLAVFVGGHGGRYGADALLPQQFTLVLG